jgi:hypothetical protein
MSNNSSSNITTTKTTATSYTNEFPLAQAERYTTTEANAKSVDDLMTKITIVIGGISVELSTGDCIQFIRDVVEGENPTTIAKILGFGGTIDRINRIFYVPWRTKENRWGTNNIFNPREIGLMHPYVGGSGGNWTTITKLTECPDMTILKE